MKGENSNQELGSLMQVLANYTCTYNVCCVLCLSVCRFVCALVCVSYTEFIALHNSIFKMIIAHTHTHTHTHTSSLKPQVVHNDKVVITKPK